MEIIRKTFEDKKDIVNARNTVESIKKLKNKTVKMVGFMTYIDIQENDNGELVDVNAFTIKTDDGKFYSSISKTALDSLNTIVELFPDDEIRAGIDVTIETHNSNSGREFLTIGLA